MDKGDWENAYYSLTCRQAAVRYFVHSMVSVWYRREWGKPLYICKMFRYLGIDFRTKKLLVDGFWEREHNSNLCNTIAYENIVSLVVA